MKDGIYTNKFEDGETVRIMHTGETVTVSRWGYVTNMQRYSYNIREHPSTFYFEEELEKVQKEETT
jgi:hypothetical protein